MKMEQKIGPSYSPDGPMLEAEVLGERNNSIDLEQTGLEIVASMVQKNYKVLFQRQHNKTRHIWSIFNFHFFYECIKSCIEKNPQYLMPILRTKSSLRRSFHTVRMQNKACSQRYIMKISRQVQMVLMGGLTMSLNLSDL